MEVRDAVEADAEALGAISDTPADVMRNLVHDRTVRVAEREGDTSGTNGEAGRTDEVNVLGFVSFDVRDRTVYITQLDGTPEASERLLAEPVRFAAKEAMDVELLVGVDHAELRTAAENAGFEKVGSGPMFEGDRTVRYRLNPAA